MGEPFTMLPIFNFDRILCASPDYIKKHVMPDTVEELFLHEHKCLLLRYPGLKEFYWSLQVKDEVRRFEFESLLESDDSDVLTSWAMTGCGIINKPIFEIQEYLDRGELVEVVKQNPPTILPFSCVYPHKKLQDPKIRLFINFISQECKKQLK